MLPRLKKVEQSECQHLSVQALVEVWHVYHAVPRYD